MCSQAEYDYWYSAVDIIVIIYANISTVSLVTHS